MKLLEMNHVQKNFDGLEVIKDISLSVEEGEVVSIIGPSGSGKSTLLRCATMLEKMDGGELIYLGDKAAWEEDGKCVYASKKDLKKIHSHYGLVFQNFNLFPHYNVMKNITDSIIRVDKVPKEEAVKRAESLLEQLGLSDKKDSYPCQLSGGQQQRVAIARALVKMPRILLLDETLSNLDARLRLQTREEIRRIQKETGITTIFVTHDQEEAMSISDMIVVMKLGVVQQIGQPQEVYDNPVNLFVAKFLGTPPINVFNGNVKEGKVYIGEDAVLDVAGVEDQEVLIGIRPEGFILDENGPFECKLNNVEVMGRDVSIVCTNEASANPVIRAIIDADNKVDATKDTVRYSIKPNKLFVFKKDTEERIYFEVK